MTTDKAPPRELSKTELRRVADEFQSERDAAKRDVMRIAEERDNALAELAGLRAAPPAEPAPDKLLPPHDARMIEAMDELEAAMRAKWEAERDRISNLHAEAQHEIDEGRAERDALRAVVAAADAMRATPLNIAALCAYDAARAAAKGAG